MDDRESQINYLIDNFDFERVHTAMKAVDWQWMTTEGNGLATPSIDRIRAMARHLLRESIKNKVVCSGGLEARYHPAVDDEPEMFALRFILCSADSIDG